jgi:hypothetical protein
MNQLLKLFIVTYLITACDAPVKTRVPTAPSYNNISGQGVVDNGVNVNNNNNNTGSGGSTGNNGSSEPGYENCDLSLQFSGGSLGYFGICQNTQDERKFKAVFAQSNTSGTCFVPVYIQNGGSSYKLGIAECVHNQANTNYFMTLNKEMMPPTFSYPRSEQINGVMVIQSSSVNAYMGCMNAKADYFVATYGCCYQQVQYSGRLYCLQTNPQCESAANSYANNVCNSFVQNHSNKYRQVSF